MSHTRDRACNPGIWPDRNWTGYFLDLGLTLNCWAIPTGLSPHFSTFPKHGNLIMTVLCLTLSNGSTQQMQSGPPSSFQNPLQPGPYLPLWAHFIPSSQAPCSSFFVLPRAPSVAGLFPPWDLCIHSSLCLQVLSACLPVWHCSWEFCSLPSAQNFSFTTQLGRHLIMSSHLVGCLFMYCLTANNACSNKA